jgi:hypothetical protein
MNVEPANVAAWRKSKSKLQADGPLDGGHVNFAQTFDSVFQANLLIVAIWSAMAFRRSFCRVT